MRRVGLELAADRDHEAAHVVGLDVAQAPHVLEQLPLGHEAPGIAREQLDDLPLRTGKPHVVPVAHGCAWRRGRW